MKKVWASFLLILGLLFTGCANNNQAVSENSNEKIEDKETIYASFYPIYNLTKQIAGDKFEVKSFTNLNTEVHDFELSAKDMKDLSSAKVLFLNGAGLESWQDKIKSAVDIDMIDTSEGVDLIKTDHDHDHEDYEHGGQIHENHEHDDHSHEDHKHENHEYRDHDHEDHNHEDKGGHHHHNHGLYDPHIWLSPKNGIIQARNIKDKLVEIDPENENYYNKNFEKIQKELEEIDKTYQDKLENLPSRKFIVDHEAFSYLARDYKLEQIPLTSISSTGEVDAKTMKKAVDFVNNQGIGAIFYEKGGSNKNVQVLADELDLKAQALDTIEYANEGDIENKVTYQSIVEKNLETIESSLK